MIRDRRMSLLKALAVTICLVQMSATDEVGGPKFEPSINYLWRRRTTMATEGNREAKFLLPMIKIHLESMIKELNEAKDLPSSYQEELSTYTKLHEVSQTAADKCTTITNRIKQLRKEFKVYKINLVPYLEECEALQRKFCRDSKKDLSRQIKDLYKISTFKESMKLIEFQKFIIQETKASWAIRSAMIDIDNIKKEYGDRLSPDVQAIRDKLALMVAVCNLKEIPCEEVFDRIHKLINEHPHMQGYFYRCEALQKEDCIVNVLKEIKNVQQAEGV